MGLRQHLKLENYGWCINIYYVVDDLQKMEILTELNKLGCDKDTLFSITKNLNNATLDTGFTYSSYEKRSSILVIHKASSIGEFLNTFEHEKNHLEMHICEALDINPYSEKAAVLSGTLAQTIIEEALSSIAEL